MPRPVIATVCLLLLAAGLPGAEPSVLQSRVQWGQGDGAAPVMLRTRLSQASTADPPLQLTDGRGTVQGLAAGWSLECRDDVVSLAGTGSGYAWLLRRGSRSAWLQSPGMDAPPAIRLDLPGPEISETRCEPAAGEAGLPLAEFHVTGLLPDFVLTCRSSSTASGELAASSHETVVRHGELALPRIVSQTAQRGTTVVRVELPPATPTLEFAFRNADGSRSSIVRVQSRDGQLKSASVAATRWLPVDRPVNVPALELQTVQSACTAAQQAGLQPILVELTSFRELPIAAHANEIVVRQGFPPQSQVGEGEWILLAIRLRDSDGLAQSETSSDAPAPPPPRGPAPLDAPRTGFVPVDLPAAAQFATDPLPAGAAGAPNSTPAPIVWNDPPPVSDVPPVSEIPPAGDVPPPTIGPGETDPAVAGDPSPLNLDPVLGNAGLPAGLSAVPLPGLDPGVSLDPSGDPNSAAGLLDQVLAGLSPGQLGVSGGCLGQVWTTLPGELEVLIVQALLQGQPLQPTWIEQILDHATKVLAISLPPPLREQIVRDFLLYAALRPHPRWLDANGNGAVVDDIAVWLLLDLALRQLFDPWTVMQLTTAPNGQVLAVLPAVPQVPRPPVPAVPPTPSVPPAATQPPVIPWGKGDVSSALTPSQVRVPTALAAQALTFVQQRLQEVGLSAQTGKTFTDDRVVRVQPAEGTWIPPSTPVRLTLQHRVPRVTRVVHSEAQRLLTEREFRVQLENPANYRDKDLVVEQQPEAGEYLEVGGAVTIDVKRPVPVVTGLTVTRARQLLDEHGLRTTARAGYMLSDIVEEQSPAAHRPEAWQLVEPGSEVRLTRLSTEVPDLTGSSPADAQTLPAATALLRERKLAWQVDGRASQLPTARISWQSPAAGTRVDRDSALIRLRVVVPVPPLRPRQQSLTQAQQLVEAAELGAEVTATAMPGDLLYDYEVAGTGSMPAFVAPGTQVRLRPGRRVPDLTRTTSLENARERLDALGLSSTIRDRSERATDDEREFDVTRVVGQSIPPGEIVPVTTGTSVGLDVVTLRERQYEVPPLVNVLLPQARAALAARGLQLDAQDRGRRLPAPSDELVGAQVIVDQAPAPGTMINRRQPVRVEIAILIEPLVRVPNVVGMPIEDANRELGQTGLRIIARQTGMVRPAPRPDLIGRAFVLGQSPLPGQPVSKGTIVSVDLGRFGDDGVEVPMLLGHRASEAFQILRQLGLNPMIAPESGQGDFIVDDLIPRPGTRVPRGTRVLIVR
ncbi:MAG: PASTA domain-containing protein [Pirellulales bacterium]